MVALLYRSLFVIGIAAFMAVAIFASAGPSQPFEPRYPSFSNPFAQTAIAVEQLTISNKVNPSYVVNETPIGNAWKALQDRNVSTYVGSDTSQTTFRMNLGSLPGGLITTWNIEVWCRSNTTDGYFTVHFSDNADISTLLMTPTTSNGLIKCSKGPTWSEQILGGRAAVGLQGSQLTSGIIDFTKYDQAGTSTVMTPAIEYSFMRLQIFLMITQTCSAPPGAWFPWADNVACAVSQGIFAIWQGIGYIVGFFVWLGEWFIAIGQHIANYLAVIVWLYNIPGMPIQIQGFLDVFWTIILGTIGIEVYKLIKPFGN